ncbi:hypothetical protein [Alloyangia pacifica]|uniref:hypothetical protein n=1 Tax=Alloyangia pacifica TaxID=311180 RepID=UPI001CFCC6BF|nr:hypothetical protein [Alloyangia pacifica]
MCRHAPASFSTVSTVSTVSTALITGPAGEFNASTAAGGRGVARLRRFPRDGAAAAR